jgi:hypothetical protein
VEQKEDEYQQPESASVPPAPKDKKSHYECERCHEDRPHQWFMSIPSFANRWEPNLHRNKAATQQEADYDSEKNGIGRYRFHRRWT